MSRTFAILFLSLGLSACGFFSAEKGEDKFARCPDMALLAEAQGYADPPSAEWKVRAQIMEFDTRCKVSDDAASVRLVAKLAAERSGDVTDAAEVTLPLFIAVVEEGRIVEKQSQNVTLKFPSRQRFAKRDAELEAALPFGDAGTAANRRVILAFQLTPEQLAYFRDKRDARARVGE